MKNGLFKVMVLGFLVLNTGLVFAQMKTDSNRYEIESRQREQYQREQQERRERARQEQMERERDRSSSGSSSSSRNYSNFVLTQEQANEFFENEEKFQWLIRLSPYYLEEYISYFPSDRKDEIRKKLYSVNPYYSFEMNGKVIVKNYRTEKIVIIPEGVTEIGERAFYNCKSITNITIPDSVTSIGNSAFNGCSSLTAINVDTGSTTYSSQDGVLYNKNKTLLITYPAGKKETTFTIPSSVTSIGVYAFGCTSITSVTIPKSVTSIGNIAFLGCDSLTSVTFETGSNIKAAKFGKDSFNRNLRTAYLKGKAGIYISERGGKEWTKLTPAKEHFNKGETFRVKNEWESAIHEYTEAIKYDPNYIDAYHNRGYSYLNIPNYDSAIADCNEVLRINPQYPAAYLNRGTAYYDKENYDQALADYNEAVKLDPKNGFYYYCRGFAYQKKGNKQMSDADFAKARELGYKF